MQVLQAQGRNRSHTYTILLSIHPRYSSYIDCGRSQWYSVTYGVIPARPSPPSITIKNSQDLQENETPVLYELRTYSSQYTKARNSNHTAYRNSKHLSSKGHRLGCCSMLFLPCSPRFLIHLQPSNRNFQINTLLKMFPRRQDLQKSAMNQQMWGVRYFIMRVHEMENRYASRFICFIKSMSSRYLWYWSSATSPLLPSKIFPAYDKNHACQPWSEARQNSCGKSICSIQESCRTYKIFWSSWEELEALDQNGNTFKR